MTKSLVHALGAGALSIEIRSAADLRAHRAAHPPETPTVEQAALGGLVSGSLGWAFAAGYQAALARLDPEGMRGGVLGALCATEEGGGHPRAIRTALTARDRGTAPAGYTLSGRKTWVTLGSDADVLLVVASLGADAEGRNRLRVARVPSTRAGVSLEGAPPLPFVPEIAHARVALESVAVGADELLPGDGYDDALKPFRTLEDIHVTAAVLGWALGVARASEWERSWLDEALALVVLLCAAGDGSASAPETHVALAGAQGLVRRLLEGGTWSKCDEATRAMWERDRRLLDVAATVRAARLEAAWRALSRRR